MGLFPNITLAILTEDAELSKSVSGNEFFVGQGKSHAERIAEGLGHLFGETIVITNFTDEQKKHHFPTFNVIHRKNGLISKIHAALTYAKGNAVFIVSCDRPTISVSIASKLATVFSIKNVEIAVPVLNEKAEPQFAIYSASCLPLLSEMLRSSKQFSINDLLERVNVHHLIIHESEEAKKCFTIINAPFDIDKLKEKKSTDKTEQTGEWFA